MIQVVEAPGGRVFAGSLPSGVVAYIDAEWASSTSNESVPAVLFSADGDTDSAAVRAFGAIGEAAARAVVSGPFPADGRLEVWGRGAVALAAAAALGVEPGDGGLNGPDKPAAIIETTGDPDRVEAATRALGDLGTLVLVGEPLGRSLSLDLYRDVHSRGLRVIGVPPLLTPGDSRPEPPPGTGRSLLQSLAKVQFGTPLPDSAAWFRLSDAIGADIVN